MSGSPSSLSPKKRALLEKWKNAQHGASASPEIAVSPRGNSIPLSFAQQRLWYLHQLDPSNAAYNMPGALRLKGSLNLDALRGSLNHVISRHEALRTLFPSVGGVPTQVILSKLELTLALENVGEGPAPEQRIRALAIVEARQPFDLAQGPLIRVRLLKVGEDDHVLLYTLHHIIADGWSLGILTHEISAAYRQFISGTECALPKLPIQYADYAAWQRKRLEAGEFQAQLDYWRKELSGELPTLKLPADFERPEKLTFNGGVEMRSLSPALSQLVRDYALREGITSYMLLLAAFKVLLFGYSRQTDLVVGSAIANRNYLQVEGLIGFFVNMLVLRSQPRASMPVREFVQQIRAKVLGAVSHQDLPFERLVEEIDPKRGESNNPIFQVVFTLQNYRAAPLRMPGLEFSSLDFGRRTSKFELSLFVTEGADGITAAFEYSTDLFRPAAISRMLRAFEQTLQQMLANPDGSLCDALRIGSAEEAFLIEKHCLRSPYPRDATITALFEGEVRRQPLALAIRSDEEALTYRDLDGRAEEIAARLRQEDLGTEPRIGVCASRSVWQIATALGVLKAGGAYVPLDPEYPTERLRVMMEDADLAAILIENDLDQERLGPSSLFLDIRRCAESDGASLRSSKPNVRAQNLAYIIYTSGTSGRPKGVCVNHRAVVRLVRDTNYFSLEAGDSVAQVASFSFDAWTFEVWGPLLNGARIELLSKETALSPDLFLERIQRSSITHCFLTTALFNQFTRVSPAIFKSLKALMVGGEAVDVRRMQETLQNGAPNQLLHVYGPTEATTFALFHRVSDVLERDRTVPIGGPISNTDALILDPAFSLTGSGMPGELCLGGDGLARGYWKRPDLTADRFIPHCCGKFPGERLYRSGDLCRYNENGAIEFLGRIDRQVKIRGFRVELDEVQTVLREAPGVSDAVVILSDDEPGNKVIAGFVVPDAGSLTVANFGNKAEMQGNQLSEWQSVFDDHIYDGIQPGLDPTFNIAGWDSVATGEAIAREDMQEWLDDTINTILSRKPSRILEIGCGTGMLLFRLGSLCERYEATDISATALDYVRTHLRSLGAGQDRFELHQKFAHELNGFRFAPYDLIILNSVVQYFPSRDYLVQALEEGAKLLAPGGAIFLGDLRSLPLQETFWTHLEFTKADPNSTVGNLKLRVSAGLTEEKELLLDPACLTSLVEQSSRIRRVEVFPKRGRGDNELMKFRFQAILHASPAPSGDFTILWKDFSEFPDPASMLQWVATVQARAFGILSIPNARVQKELSVASLLKEAADGATVADIRKSLANRNGPTVHPDDVFAWAPPGFQAKVSWARHGADGAFDVLFHRSEDFVHFPTGHESGVKRPQTNQPLYTKQVRRLLEETHELLRTKLPAYMVPGRLAAIPRIPLNANGKLDRRALDLALQSEPARRERFAQPTNRAEAVLSDIWKEILRSDNVGIHDNFFSLGGDSILSIQIVARARDAGIEITTRQLLQRQTISELSKVARFLVQRSAKTDLVAGEAPLTPVQRWFFDRNLEDPHFFNQALLLELKTPLNGNALAAALTKVCESHDAFQLRYLKRDADWVQFYRSDGPDFTFQVVDVDMVPAVDRLSVLSAIASQTHRSLHLANGPLMRVIYFVGGGLEELFFTAHHLIFDAVSWRIFLEELETAYGQVLNGGTPRLPVSTTHFQEWSRAIAHHAQTDDCIRDAEYWLSREYDSSRLPRDFAVGENRVRDVRVESFSLSKEETSILLREAPIGCRATLNDILVASAAWAVRHWSEQPLVSLQLEGHGREEIIPGLDITRTIGWFTTMFPVYFRTEGVADMMDLLQIVKEELQKVPKAGMTFGLLRHLGPAHLRDRFATLPKPEISLNYLGQVDQTVRKGGFVKGFKALEANTQSSDNQRAFLIEVGATVVRGSLHCTLSYNSRIHRPERAQQLGSLILGALAEIADRCRQGVDRVRPSDFPLAQLSESQLQAAFDCVVDGESDFQ